MSNFTLPFDDAPASRELDAGDPIAARIDARDRAGRARAVDPRFNVALEASAGTGKTRVLVDRYVNLLRAGVDPANVDVDERLAWIVDGLAGLGLRLLPSRRLELERLDEGGEDQLVQDEVDGPDEQHEPGLDVVGVEEAVVDRAVGERVAEPARHCCIEPECAEEAQQSGGSPSWKGAKKGSNHSTVPLICRL